MTFELLRGNSWSSALDSDLSLLTSLSLSLLPRLSPDMSSPSLEPLKLVFRVADPQGDPYKKTSFEKILLSPKSDVSDFRKAVKAENSDILIGISPSQLTVYKNKAVFDVGKEPLDEFSLLDNTFGTSKENALIVVVPTLSSGMRMFFSVEYSRSHNIRQSLQWKLMNQSGLHLIL